MLLKNISSNYRLKQIFSSLPINIFYKIIKYNKYFQTKLNINFKDSIFNYELNYLEKSEIFKNIEDMEKKYNISNVLFNAKFSFYYSYNFQTNFNDIYNTNIFLKTYKGFKINYYPFPSNFVSMNIKDKIIFFEKNESFYKYTLSDESVKFINLINEFREKNNISKLIYNKIENMNDYFKEKNSNNKYYLLSYPLGIFNNDLLTLDKNLKKILLIKELNCIMILEKGNNKYVFIYSISNVKDVQKLEIPKNIKVKYFHIINNTIPEVNLKTLSRKIRATFLINLKECFKTEGYQIFILNDKYKFEVICRSNISKHFILFIEIYFPRN